MLNQVALKPEGVRPMTTIYHATYESRHFTFEAFGLTEQEARETLVDGLHTHATQYEIEPTWFDEDDISVTERTIGKAYRDHSEFGDVSVLTA